MNKSILKDTIFDEANAELLERFWQYHKKNRWVYVAFKRYAAEMRRYRNKYSAWAIVQRIRWEYDVSPTIELFKINNDYIALYARLLMADDPSFGAFFELRCMKKYDRRYSAEERYRRGA